MQDTFPPIRTPVRKPVRAPIRTPVRKPVRAPIRTPIRTPVPIPEDEQTLSKKTSTATADLQLDEEKFIIDRCLRQAEHFGLMEAGRILKVHPKLFVEWLRKEGYIFGKGSHIQIRVSTIAAGLLEAKVSSAWKYSRPMMTINGLCHFAIMIKRGLIPENILL